MTEYPGQNRAERLAYLAGRLDEAIEACEKVMARIESRDSILEVSQCFLERAQRAHATCKTEMDPVSGKSS